MGEEGGGDDLLMGELQGNSCVIHSGCIKPLECMFLTRALDLYLLW